MVLGQLGSRAKGLCVLFSMLSSNGVFAQELVSESTATTLKYDDWMVRCNQAQGQAEECAMTQKVSAPNTNRELFEANFAKTERGTQMTLVLPLGIFLPNGVVVEVVDWDKAEFPIDFCTKAGCFVNRILSEDFVNLLRKKESANVILWTTADQKATIPLSLAGFLGAYKKL